MSVTIDSGVPLTIVAVDVSAHFSTVWSVSDRLSRGIILFPVKTNMKCSCLLDDYFFSHHHDR